MGIGIPSLILVHDLYATEIKISSSEAKNLIECIFEW